MKIAVATVAGLLLTGCLSPAEEGGVKLCERTTDCGSGETCSDGICYGNPPAIAFSAVLEPPAGTENLLVPTELTSVDISAAGDLVNLEFERPFLISGQVILACGPTTDPSICGEDHPIEAVVEARRASAIPGLPPLVRHVVTSGETPSFTLALPESKCADKTPENCEDAYVLTVAPVGSNVGSGTTPAELAPPVTTVVVADRDLPNTQLVVGDPTTLKTVGGCIVYGAGLPGVPDYQVSVFGRITAQGDLVRASSRAITDATGCFEVRLPINLIDRFDFVFEPTANTTLPTTRVSDINVPDEFVGETFLVEPAIELPDFSTSVAVIVPITAVASDGEKVPVPGASVRFSTQFESADSRDVTVTFSTTAVTSIDLGQVEVNLFPGNRDYDVVIIPPVDSEFGSRFDAQLSVGTVGGVVQPIEIKHRIAMRGRMVNEFGVPIAQAPVTAKPSSAFLFDVVSNNRASTPLQTLMRNIVFSTVTDDDGVFFLWVDRDLGGVRTSYDLSIDPPLVADAPPWTFEAVDVSGDIVDLGDLFLPRASYARGVVVDSDGNPVEAAKLLLFQRPNTVFCDDKCSPPPFARGVRVSDETGAVPAVVLPDPGVPGL